MSTATDVAVRDQATGAGRYGGSDTSAVDRYEWAPVDVPDPVPSDRLRGRHVLVVGGSVTARADVTGALRLAGAHPGALPRDAEDEPTAAGVRAAVEALVAAAGPVDGIIDLGVPGRFDPQEAVTPGAAWRAALRRTTATVQAVYRDWSSETDARRCFYLAVTWMGGRMGYDRTGVAQPLGGVWAGIAKSLPHELPACRVKVLDLAEDEAEHVGRLAVLEASAVDWYEVGWRAGARVTLGARAVPCPPPRLRLGPDDVVLVSGGGRGVGFAFARRLAADVGCRVVVTGRTPLTSGPWSEPDDAAWAALKRERLRGAGAAVGAVRRELRRWDAARETHANLAAARAEGLPVEYRACDVLDGEQVRALVTELGDALRVVVHNAGVAAPTRLERKDPEVVLGVVESKLVGFVHLAQALRGHDVAYVCNVGSVAGRMGGMVGQVDYAGANEVLSRLGFWAQEARGLPVATICWTTWEQIGLIANYEAALRYGAALRVPDGVRRWVEEVRGAAATESMVLGRIGTALAPTQIRGFLKFSDSPDLPWLLSRQHYLGDVEVYAPARRVVSRSWLAAGTHPCLSEVAVDGRPALPVSVALEYALSVGDWVAPEGWPVLHLREVRDVAVDVSRLAVPAGGAALRKQGVGAQEGDEWVVRVRLGWAPGQAAGDGAADVDAPLLSAVLVYHRAPGTAADVEPAPAATAARTAPAAPRLAARAALPVVTWRALVYPAPRWRAGQGDAVVASVRPAFDADAWALPYPPTSVLPSAAVEAAVQGLLAAQHPGTEGDTDGGADRDPDRDPDMGRGTVLALDRLTWTPSGAPEAELTLRPGTGDWTVRDASGGVILRCAGARLR